MVFMGSEFPRSEFSSFLQISSTRITQSPKTMGIKSYPFHLLLETEYLTRLCVLVESLSFFSFSLVNELRLPFCINYTLRDTLQCNFGGNIFSFPGSLLKRNIFSRKKERIFILSEVGNRLEISKICDVWIVVFVY